MMKSIFNLLAEENEWNQVVKDAARYKKLQRWMGSNVPEGWEEVEKLGAVCAWVGWDEMDKYLDDLPECNVGLCYKRPE